MKKRNLLKNKRLSREIKMTKEDRLIKQKEEKKERKR
jgi:hypothetical protein